MEAHIDTHYSPGELREISDELVTIGVLTKAEATQNEPLDAIEIDFLDLNDLLQPAFSRLVSFSNDSRKGWFDQSETDYFYEWFALQLLRGCPLRHYLPTCQEAEKGHLVLRAESASIIIDYQSLNHPEFIERLVAGVNSLLYQHGFEVGYYELVGLDEITWFLLLTPNQYEHLLHNRLVYFADVEYPEVEAWRRTLRKEDLPF